MDRSPLLVKSGIAALISLSGYEFNRMVKSNTFIALIKTIVGDTEFNSTSIRRYSLVQLWKLPKKCE